MKKPELTVIEGGVPYMMKTREKFLVSAYITDTRLMGVLAIYAHWRLEAPDEDPVDIHQFYYIDCEESGLETYKSVQGNDQDEINAIEQAIVGGLGAEKKELTYRSLSIILTFYRYFNESLELPLPAKYGEYSFLIDPGTVPDPKEAADIMNMICGEITSDFQAINYFLMRCFGQDERGAGHLYAGKPPIDMYSDLKLGTFCRNVIDVKESGEDGVNAYLCESLVEKNGNYTLVISEVHVKNRKIVMCDRCSSFPVTSVEAAMMLSKAEFVTVYEVLLSEEEMENNTGELTINFNTIMSSHENGKLFMTFKLNNDHVNSREFRLSNDVKGIYYLTDYGQLIAAAYTLDDIRFMERHLKSGPLDRFLLTTSKYEFKEPVLFEFMQSDFEDFDDFLSYIRDL